jgi:hypothetical protein
MKKLIIIFLLLMPILAKAEWKSITRSADQETPLGGEYSVDFSSILNNGGYSRVWVLLNYYATQISKVNNQSYASSKMYWEIDCSNRKLRFLSIAYFSKKNAYGSVIETYTYNPPSDWIYIGPGDNSSIIAKYVCH